MFTPLGLDHIVLRVRDQAAAQRFYTEVLGCTLDHVNERIALVQLRFGEHLIDLLPAEPVGTAVEAGATAPAGTASPAGVIDHFCLSIRCDDLHKVADDLRQRGVTVEGDVVDRRGAYGHGPSLYLRDLDGYKIELKPRA